MIFYLICVIAVVIIIIASLIIDNFNTITIYPAYLFEFINRKINDEFNIKSLTESNLLVDDDGFEILSVNDFKKLKKVKNLIPVSIKISNTLYSYLNIVFKSDYIVLCEKVDKNIIFKPNDFILVYNYGNYYIREVCNDNGNDKVLVYSPKGRHIDYAEFINRVDIVGKVINYNKYRVNWIDI